MRPSETLICDTSFVSHLWRRLRAPARYQHWDSATVDRVEAALLAINVVTVAELQAGRVRDRWGGRRVAQAERSLAVFESVTIDDPHLEEWARLRVAAWDHGIAISDNDLWIAATASTCRSPLVTCDRDHQRIAPQMPVEVVFLAPPV
ncbi:MAG: type II toxin-antitoxin system VapC family toxin [Actinobacteria bacterium]|nr:type II toxin-antitoxin system VapC family toxin [Actinomycetota bacterium]